MLAGCEYPGLGTAGGILTGGGGGGGSGSSSKESMDAVLKISGACLVFFFSDSRACL